MSLFTFFITFFLAVSIGIIVALGVKIFRRRPQEEERVYGLSRLLVYSGLLIGSVWSLRYAVGLFSIFYPELSAIAPDDALVNLNWLEEILNSFIHALQTFSMDEDYTAYIITGKTMMREIYGCGPILQAVFGAYASVLNVIAPIAGGAVIFEILASIMPGIRLWVYCHCKTKEKCYFSELNEYSLALAKSIAAAGDRRTVIVFTDAYVDDEDEKSSETLNEAKNLGAICLKDDLSHVMKNKRGPKRIFLMDKDEIGNLQTLTELADSGNSQYIKDSRIYLFVNDDAYVQVEKNVCKKLREDWKLEGVEDENLPINIIPVRSYRNMVSNLLVDYPLYEPLIGKKFDGPRKLTVTILGTGHIGMEMFLSTYWFGQLLDCELIIRVISQEKEEDFWGKIDSVNPEIRRTMNVDDPILKMNKRGDKATPYCKVKYMECDVRSSAFIKSLQSGENDFRGKDGIVDTDGNPVRDGVGATEGNPAMSSVGDIDGNPVRDSNLSKSSNPEKRKDNILDTDYYLVALGSDEENISVANILRKYAAEEQIKQAYIQKKSGEKGDIRNKDAAKPEAEARKGSPDGEAGGKLAEGDFGKGHQNGETGGKPEEEESKKNQKDGANPTAENSLEASDLKIIAYVVYNTALAETLNQKTSFSSCEGAKIYMRAVGSLEEVYSGRNVFLNEHKASAQAIHDSYLAVQKEDELRSLKKRIRDDYKYWANIARHCHVKYKMFSMGEITESWLDDEKYDKKTRERLEEEAYQRCRDKVAEDISGMTEEGRQEYFDLMHRMAWLEHRRWNAFTRVMGFRSSDTYSAYAKKGESGSYKEMEIKLHPCLRECDKKGIRYRENGDGTAEKLTVLTDRNGKRLDQPAGTDFDLLDDLSNDLFKNMYNGYDMKQYDYPDEDFCSGMKPRCQLTVLLQEEQKRKEKVKAWLRLYAVTDRKWAEEQSAETGARGERGAKHTEGGKTLEEQVREAIDGGVTCVQLREKKLTAKIKSIEKSIEEVQREEAEKGEKQEEKTEKSGNREGGMEKEGNHKEETERRGIEKTGNRKEGAEKPGNRKEDIEKGGNRREETLKKEKRKVEKMREELLAKALRMQKVCRGGEKAIPFIVNDDVWVAVQSGADGIHVGQGDLPIAEVRKIVGPGMIIGASAHSVEEAKAAEADGADYLGVGAVFGTSTKKDARPLSRETLCEICSAVTIPVVAIGGITMKNADKLAGSGVDGIAVVSAIFAAEDCGEAAAKMRKIADSVVGQENESAGT